MTLRELWQASLSVTAVVWSAISQDFLVRVEFLFVHKDLKENMVQILSDE